MSTEKPVLVLDAMGVIYQAGDDVAELLVPFVTSKGGARDAEAISAAYLRASRGELTAEAFWQSVGLSAACEKEYLRTHRLAPGLLDLLVRAREGFEAIWCLSNDVSEWSRALRRQFGLERYFDGWVISGDVGCRKPSTEIYQLLRAQVGDTAGELVFVDDRPANLPPARALGMRTVRFGGERGAGDDLHARDMGELSRCLDKLLARRQSGA